MVNFVFGKEYQEYIPIYFFSLYKHYPDYDAVVYVDRKLREEIWKLIKLIPKHEEKYKIINVDKLLNKLSLHQMEAYRWFLYDTIFRKYRYIYIGDIDIYICKEVIPLCEQHIRHMNSQKLVYSNIVRSYGALPQTICKYEKILKKMKLYGLIVEIYHKFFYHKRMSGLHFVESDTYFKAIKKQRERFFKVYYDTDIISKIYNLKMKFYSNNEAMLYHIIKKSHLNLPIQSDDTVNILMCKNMKSNNFRPHHGLHLGIWRGRKKADSSYDKYFQTQLFQNYYAQFKDELANDTILKEILENSPIKIKKIINAMISDLDKR